MGTFNDWKEPFKQRPLFGIVATPEHAVLLFWPDVYTVPDNWSLSFLSYARNDHGLAGRACWWLRQLCTMSSLFPSKQATIGPALAAAPHRGEPRMGVASDRRDWGHGTCRRSCLPQWVGGALSEDVCK